MLGLFVGALLLQNVSENRMESKGTSGELSSTIQGIQTEIEEGDAVTFLLTTVVNN